MIEIKEVGGVRICGAQAFQWLKPSGRWINGCVAEFDSDVYWPDVEGSVFTLPAHRGHTSYKVHLLEEGALVLKEGRAFLCTVVDGKPRVLGFFPALADSEIARSL